MLNYTYTRKKQFSLETDLGTQPTTYTALRGPRELNFVISQRHLGKK